MLKKVKKFLKNNSPDWLNTEVNRNLLQNFTTNINCSPRPELGEGLGEKAEIKIDSKQISKQPISARLNSDRLISTECPTKSENCLQFPTPGTPHWRRIKQVFVALDNAPANYTYSQLIEYVRTNTGKGCSRKLISKWKKQKLNLIQFENWSFEKR